MLTLKASNAFTASVHYFNVGKNSIWDSILSGWIYGPNIIAIILTIGANNACNLDNKKNNLYLIFAGFVKNNSQMTQGQFSTLEAYMVLIESDCKHK